MIKNRYVGVEAPRGSGLPGSGVRGLSTGANFRLCELKVFDGFDPAMNALGWRWGGCAHSRISWLELVPSNGRPGELILKRLGNTAMVHDTL